MNRIRQLLDIKKHEGDCTNLGIPCPECALYYLCVDGATFKECKLYAEELLEEYSDEVIFEVVL